MISQELLEILACPACKGEIEEIKEKSILLCKNCKRGYPVKDGIPVMLIEESEIFENQEK